ncbi:MAG: hypothetical protein D6776_01870, partial [Planctomycetota bacterium]
GFAPAARLGRTASFEIEAAGLAAPRWFRFGRTLDAVRSRYSGERLHAPHELHLPVGTRRVASDAPRIAAPRLEAVYGRRWRFDVPVGQGADALGLGAHGLEGRYAAQRWLETSRSLTIEPALYGGGVTGVRGPVFATTGAPGMDTLQLGGRSVPAAAPRSARAASRRGARVPSGAAPAARLGAGAGAGFIPMPSTGSRTVTSYVQVLEALGLGAGAPALGGMVAPPAEPGLRATEPVSLQVGQGATGRRGWAPIAAPRTGFADRFRLDGWLPAPAFASGRGGQGGSVGALGATGRRLEHGVGGRARSFAPPVTPATIPLDLVSQLGGVTDRVARAAARRLAWAPPVAAGARRPTFALAQLAPLADEQTSGPLAGSIAMGSRRRVVSHRRDRVFAIGGSARRAAARAARLAAPLADTGATAGLEELAAVVPSRPAARRRTGRVPTLEGIELGGAFIERRRRSRFDAERLRRVGVPVPIGSEWIEAIEQTEREGADMPLVQRLAAPRARSSDTAPISLAVGQGGRGPSALSRLVDEVVGRPRTVGRRPAIEQARAFERTRREVESGLAWLGGDEAVAQRREPVRPSRGLSDAFRPRTDRGTRRWSGFESQPPRAPAAFGRVREPVEARPPRLKMVNTGVGAPREQFDLAEVLQQAFDLPEEALPVMRKGLFSGLATNIKKSLGEVTQWIAQLEKLRKPRQRTPDISQLVYQVYDRIKSEMEWEAMRRGVV